MTDYMGFWIMVIFVPHEHLTNEGAGLGIVTLLPQLGHLTLREDFPDVFPPLTFSSSFTWMLKRTVSQKLLSKARSNTFEKGAR